MAVLANAIQHTSGIGRGRATFLPFARPSIGTEEIEAVVRTLHSEWLTTGPQVFAFERAFASYVGAAHAIAVNSATAALHLALEAIGLRAGDEVITTPYTFAATAEVVRYFDARPVFVDIRQKDLNLNPDLVEAAITPRTRAIVPVHMAGQACAMEAILAIARQHGLRVVEDAAHALPTRFQGKLVGTFGDATAFSFYATKNLTTGEGGMITTDDPALAARMQIMRLHGISRDAWKRYAADGSGSWFYDIIAPGYKYNMTDIAAAMGMCQLAKLESMTERRAAIATRYSDAFRGVDCLEVPEVVTEGTHAWHLYILRLHHDRLTIDRDRFIEHLTARKIGTSVHFIPLHLHPYYRQVFGYQPTDFPIAYAEYQRVVSLPIYAAMSDQDVDDVIAAVLETVHHARK